MTHQRHPQPFTVALIQMRCSVDPADNLEKARTMLGQAARGGAQVACLPELFRTQYFCQSEEAARFDLSEPIPGPTTEMLANVAREMGMVVVGSIFERRAAGIFHNTAVVIDADGGLRGRYRKMHIPDDPLYYEKYYFTPGDLGFQAFDTSFARVGTLICWDQWYPEAARLTALLGAEILFYPTAIGWHPGEKAQFGEAQTSAWETIQRAHAIANGVYVAAVNRIGHEGSKGGGLEFWGGSFLADPFGRIIARAGHDTEEVLIATCDPKLLEETRRNWPFFRDRRIDAYAPITKRFLDGT
jgi:N-carbamoylputrescine amidase